MRTVIYARYSAGPRQTDQSIEGQVRVCTDYCDKNGLTVQEIYADRHISGKTDERPEFRRMIADAKLKKFDAVVVYRTDRFARNKYDSAIYKRELRQAGVKLYYAAESIPEGPEGIILESLMEGLAEYYSAELAQKIKRGIHESALKGKAYGSNVPFGLRLKEDRTLEPDPETAPVVKKIFEKYINGENAADICRWLNSCGYRTSTGKEFNKNSLPRILNNKKYIGVYEAAGVILEDKIEPIISKELFYLAKHEMDKKKKRKTSRVNTADYLLSGKLFCGHCGSAMQGVSGTSKTGRAYYYYACPGKKKKTCEKKNVSRDWLEDAVVRGTVGFLLQEDRLRQIAVKMYRLQAEGDTTEADIAEYKKKLRENKTASENLLRALEKGLAADTLLARLKELEDERQAIEGEIAYLKARNFGLSEDELEFFLRQFIRKDGESDEEYKKKIITCFVTKVILYDDKLKILYSLTADGAALESEIQLSESSSSDSSSPLHVIPLEHKRGKLRVFSHGLALELQIDP